MSSQVCQSVQAGTCDIGFCSKLLDAPNLDHAPFQTCRMIVAVPEGHPLADRPSVTLEDTLDYRHVTYSWLSGQRDTVDRLFAPVRDRWKIAYEVEDANFIMELVAQDFGITVMLETPPVFRPGIRILPLAGDVPEWPFYILRRKDASSPAAANLFYQFCLEQCLTPSP